MTTEDITTKNRKLRKFIQYFLRLKDTCDLQFLITNTYGNGENGFGLVFNITVTTLMS